ncbi:hypothetical protein IFM89_031454 [Coptis chinensis]|uniref:Uncharacterized protein n=1 Tax=Coptis chinensis TaxID=261450 RepID=A0A835HFG0_9MAGN|nr:hypothetical protein IFM89_031454 [Coptis chinensis]
MVESTFSVKHVKAFIFIDESIGHSSRRFVDGDTGNSSEKAKEGESVAADIGCFICGENYHWSYTCPWKRSPCSRCRTPRLLLTSTKTHRAKVVEATKLLYEESPCNRCRTPRLMLTSTKPHSKYKKFYKCENCLSFEWLKEKKLSAVGKVVEAKKLSFEEEEKDSSNFKFSFEFTVDDISQAFDAKIVLKAKS